MPKWVVKLADNEYVLWSTVVDSPVSAIFDREEAVEEYGADIIERCDRQITSCTAYGPSSMETFISLNRAGPGECGLTLEAIRERFASQESYDTFELAVHKLLPVDDSQWQTKQAELIAQLTQKEGQA